MPLSNEQQSSRDEARQFIRNAVTSGDWWTIVSTTEEGAALANAVHHDIFNDARDPHFDGRCPFLANVDGGVTAVVTVIHKTRMSMVELQAIAATWGAISPEALSKPILFAGPVSNGVKEWFHHVVFE